MMYECILFSSIFQVDQHALTKVGVWSFRVLPGYKFSRDRALLKLEALRPYDVSGFLMWLRKILKHCLVTRFISEISDLSRYHSPRSELTSADICLGYEGVIAHAARRFDNRFSRALSTRVSTFEIRTAPPESSRAEGDSKNDENSQEK